MKKCNKFKSIQITYAIKVTDEEYARAKKIVSEFLENPKTRYSVIQNFAIAGYGIKRNVFIPAEKKQGHSLRAVYLLFRFLFLFSF